MKNIVKRVFQGLKNTITPIQIEIGNPKLESIFSDIILISGRITRFNEFYKTGGPFKRETSRRKWAESIDLTAYDWPSLQDVKTEFEKRILNILTNNQLLKSDKFKILKILGPTETAESFCAEKIQSDYYNKGDIYHQFNYSYLSTFKPEKGEKLHDILTDYIEYIISESEIVDIFDAIRIADDIFDYQGLLYPEEFIKKTWRKNHKRITQAIKKRKKYSILHTDGNPVLELTFIDKMYDGIHPLDLMPKNSKKEFEEWLKIIKNIRKNTSIVFFTGIPINLLYGNEVKFELLRKFIPKILSAFSNKKFILSTTHRPYPTINIHRQVIQKKYQKLKKLIDEYHLPK
ncbi:MAG: hypothetical protein ACTSYR_05720 [Candidatus Odinarchaeia archaeon]